jgi:16S rRNA C1402 (ribose-2'-O) methylase RsmI
MCLAREITKKFEEYIRGGILEVLENIKTGKACKQGLLGECVVLINAS